MNRKTIKSEFDSEREGKELLLYVLSLLSLNVYNHFTEQTANKMIIAQR